MYANADGIMLCYNTTDESSLEFFKDLVDSLNDIINDPSKNGLDIMLIGNKSDLNHNTNIEELVAIFSKKNNYFSMKTSAKNKNNVNEAFQNLTGKILNRINKIENKENVGFIKNILNFISNLCPCLNGYLS